MRIEIEKANIVCCDPQKRKYSEGHLIIEDGRIQSLGSGPVPQSVQRAKRIDGRGKIVIPGFINAHTHSYANITRGLNPGFPLEVWMVYSGAASQGLSPRDIYLSALLGCMEMVRTGTTTCLDHIHINLGMEAMEQAAQAFSKIGIRAFLAPMASDKSYADSLPLSVEEKKGVEGSTLSRAPAKAAVLEILEKGLRTWSDRQSLVRSMVGYSGPHRCSDEFIKACHELAQRYDVGVHTHLLETRIQAITGQEFYGEDMITHLDKLGVLNRRASFAHGVWLSRDQGERLAEGGCSVIHNPQSNLFLGSGIAPIPMLREEGVNIALGTDGSNCGGTQSMFQSLRLAGALHNGNEADYKKWPTAEDVIGWATLGGAKALLAEDEIGSLEKGKKADLLILGSSSPCLTPLYNPVVQIATGDPALSVEIVIVDGEVVLKDGRLTLLDEQAILEEVKDRAKFIEEAYERNVSESARQIEVITSMYKRLQHKS